jgi:hypothetical protein
VTAIGDSVKVIDTAFPEGLITIQRSIWKDTNTRYVNETGEWKKAAAKPFPLLESVGGVDTRSVQLSKIWETKKQQLQQVIELGFLENS